ncbi:chorismate lyase [Actinobacillus equuli subsp. haemolyticus]|nr:chorismate lyase [Actinobacillus equuli]MDG4947615.1 chorismate lyase [Actinobacillus equuli subsp. haemolyticus]WGE52426.1 chorismate lyase [Actinobacillus equuli subsp. haemolyticus]WGE62697.1 chorismate lyase [Actinobacillus equuli subsp. haemolyticus]WGE66908.1 chorismate lyase [Actinobacillus equuli subsp. haemolyticus]WGE71866.1 chorismate lyase [Actinobacillus equuli subsp. haemolyticus]
MLTQYRKILMQDHWQVEPTGLTAQQSAWLLHQGSLTQKLLQVTRDFNVQITDQRWLAKNSENMTACGLSDSSDYWLREVLLKEGDQAWIFAQTLLPKQTIENVAGKVPILGEQPIGLWLFAQHPERTLLAWQQDCDTGMYMRRACYRLNGYPLEIRELFLPAFPFP